MVWVANNVGMGGSGYDVGELIPHCSAAHQLLDRVFRVGDSTTSISNVLCFKDPRDSKFPLAIMSLKFRESPVADEDLPELRIHHWCLDCGSITTWNSSFLSELPSHPPAWSYR